MPVDRLEVRVSITKLLLALVIVIVPLSIVGLVLTTRSDKSLDNTIGNNFRALAQTYSNEVSQYVRDRVSDVNAMAADTSVVNAVLGSTKATSAQKTAAPNATGSKAIAKGTPNSNATDFLRQRRNLDQRFLSVTVTNDSGTVLASTQPITKASYSDDEGWQGAYNKGQGAVKISGILDDELSKAYYLNIGVPVGDPISGHLIGVLTAAVSISPLLTRFQQDQLGNGARASLVDENGTIVSGPHADVFARMKSPEFDAIRDSIGSVQGSQSGWQMASLQNGPYIVGYAATGLKQNFNNLGWFVLVSQDEHQAAAPIRGLERFAMIMVILALFMLTLLCVYYFLHRSQKFEDIEGVLPTEPGKGRATAA